MRFLIPSIFLLFVVLSSVSASLTKEDCRCRPRTAPKIIGGKVGRQVNNQYLVGILSAEYEAENFTVCAGTILNENYILTAGSCVPPSDDQESIDLMRIRLNEVNELLKVKEVIVHEQYNRSKFEADHDIALIKLEQPLNFTEIKTIQPACLDSETKSFNMLHFAGFGSSNVVTINDTTNEIHGFMPSKALKQGSAMDRTDKDDFCKDKKERSICVGNLRKSDAICLGDSGSGLFHLSNGRKLLVAVASLPTPEVSESGDEVKLCTKGTRAARLSAYMKWIEDHVESDHC